MLASLTLCIMVGCILVGFRKRENMLSCVWLTGQATSALAVRLVGLVKLWLVRGREDGIISSGRQLNSGLNVTFVRLLGLDEMIRLVLFCTSVGRVAKVRFVCMLTLIRG